MALKINWFNCSFTYTKMKKISKLKSFESNILPLFQSYETMHHGVEKKFQMPVLGILGLG